jgi:hypothetical protein
VEELKCQLADREKAMAELDKKLKQVRIHPKMTAWGDSTVEAKLNLPM